MLYSKDSYRIAQTIFVSLENISVLLYYKLEINVIRRKLSNFKIETQIVQLADTSLT